MARGLRWADHPANRGSLSKCEISQIDCSPTGLPRRPDDLIWLLDLLVAVLGHIPLAGHHLAELGRLARASALLLMFRELIALYAS
jgi:hypothetical protein